MKRVVCVGLMALIGCGIDEREKQVKTVVYMQSVAARLQDVCEQTGHVPSARRAASLIGAVNGGRDAWGQPLVYFSNGTSYVLISRGSDRRLESSEWMYYFTMKPHEIHDDASRDIVLRDSEFIARGGK